MSLATIKINVITPKEATNYVTNPSIEVAATGYTLLDATSITRVTTQSRRGAASLQVVPANNVPCGVYYAIALTSGTQYSFSADILDIAGQGFNLCIANSANAPKSAVVTWTGTGHWRRRSVTWTADASATFHLQIFRSAVVSTTAFYVDGFQLEIGAVSTYLDGSLKGYVSGQTAYRWNGAADASTSWRSGQTRSGGTYVNIGDYARVLQVPGLGMAPISNIALSSSLGGAFYQNTIYASRGFSVVCHINKAGDYALIEAARSALTNALVPDATGERQPLLLQIDQFNSSSVEVAETLMVKCLYEGGLEGYGDVDAYNERIALNFRMYSPLLEQDGDHATALGYQTSIASAAFVLQRSEAGTWAVMGTGATGFPPFALVVGIDGTLYAGGAFTAMGGVAATDYIAKWDGSAWSAMAAGANAAVNALAVAPNGDIYAGGAFTNLGSANGDYIVRWDGAAFNALSTGTGGIVNAIAVALDGSIYAGGEFTNLTDANGDYISRFIGGAWASLGTGMNEKVYALYAAPDGTIYAGGNFTLAGGVAATAYIAKWNGTAWLPLGTGMDGIVYAITGGPDGSIYAGGAFTLAGGVADTAHIARWNGTAWVPLGTGAPLAVSINYLGFFGSMLYAGGKFSSIGGVTTTDSVAQWNGFSWTPLDVILPTGVTKVVYSVVQSRQGGLFISFYSSGTAYGATVTAPNAGGATGYPVIKFTGPGTCYQLKNYTTGKSIFFNLALLVGETAILDLNPKQVSFTSSFRGNILSAILPGSDMIFTLLPGANNVSAFMYGSTSAATAINMIWKYQYPGIDGAIR